VKSIQHIIKFSVLVFGIIATVNARAQLINVSGGEIIKPPKFEFGIAPYSLVVAQKDIVNGESYGKQNYFANALFARFWVKDVNLRCNLNRYVDDYNFLDYQVGGPIPLFEGDVFSTGTYSLNSATRKAVEIKFGWQQFITHTRVSPYVTADIGYSNIRERVFYSEQKDRFGNPIYYNYLANSAMNRISLYAGVGLRLQITSFLAMSFETQASFNYDWKKSNSPKASVKNGPSLGLFPAQFLLGYYF
jgi:hypothetical protein